MAGLRLSLFLGILCSCYILGMGDVVPAPPAEHLIDVDPTVSTAVAGITSDVPKPEEPVKPDSVPTTTESKPANTTTSSTTSTTTTTTTTPPPPPPPAPTPAPKPKPVPAPTQGTWTYPPNVSTNVSACIVTQFAAQITITYNMSVQNKTSLANVTMNVPANASVTDGSCNATGGDQWIQLGWLSDGTPAAPNSILMWFRKNDTTRNYALHTFNLTVDSSQLVNSTHKLPDNVVFSHGEEWGTPLSTSYRCTPVTKLNMNDAQSAITASVMVSSLQEEAFRTAPGKGFSAARDCGSGDVPDAVPIAVGCALGGLVLVVLAAYLVARRRSAARGYLSM